MTSWSRPIVAVVAIVFMIVLMREAHPHIVRFALWIDALGVWGPVVFIAGYALGTVAFVPGALLTLAGGAIFGLTEGTMYVFAGEVLGGAAAFLISLRLVRRTIERRLVASPRFAAIDHAVAYEGFKIVFLLRLAPVFPFSLLNYALGVTDIRFSHYLAASIGMIPGTVAYVYYGKLAGDIAAVTQGAPAEQNAASYALSGLGLVATVLVTMVVARIARDALRRAADV